MSIIINFIILIIDKPLSHWNLCKAVYLEYAKYVDDINQIEPIPDNYGRFINLIKSATKKSIPRGHRHNNYTPCWIEEYEKLLQEYERNGNEINTNKFIAYL